MNQIKFNLWAKLLLCAVIVTLVLGGIVYLANDNLNQLKQSTTQLETETSGNIGKQIRETAVNLQNILFTGLIVMFMVAGLLAVIMARVIIVPAKRLIKGARNVAEGDLTTRIEVNSSDELGELAEVFNWMIDKLEELVRKIKQDSAEVKEATQQLSTLSDKVSTTLEDQTAAVHKNSKIGQEINKSVEEMVMEIKESAKLINNTEDISSTGLEKANQVSDDLDIIEETTGELSGIMDELEKEAVEIEEIINTIDEISDSTNMLALNAAIEASRSSSGGGGFTVVAEEIRELATDVQGATSRIKDLIKNFQRKVKQAVKHEDKNAQLIKEGVNLTENTIGYFQEIGKNVLQISDEISAIKDEADSQVNKLEKVVGRIKMINQEMQKLARVSTDTASAGGVLERTVQDLLATVEEFTVEVEAKDEA